MDHVSLNIDKHEIFALLGSSGSGKSTLLRILAGMETPSQGQIILDGQDITKLQPYDRVGTSQAKVERVASNRRGAPKVRAGDKATGRWSRPRPGRSRPCLST